MSLKIGDRILQTSTTTGTGTYTLIAPPEGFQSYLDSPDIASGDRVSYLAVNSLELPTQWEIGEGIITAGPPDTLTRAQILQSSDGISAISWQVGTRYIACYPAARRFMLLDEGGKPQAGLIQRVHEVYTTYTSLSAPGSAGSRAAARYAA